MGIYDNLFTTDQEPVEVPTQQGENYEFNIGAFLFPVLFSCFQIIEGYP